MKISDNSAVTINFTMSDNKGNIIDSTDDNALTYLHGFQNILPGLEDGLTGLETGGSFDITLKPEDAFGEKDQEKIITVEKNCFGNSELEVDMQFQSEDEEGNAVVATVVEIKGDEVTVDENHPLAGMTLLFKGEVLEIRKRTQPGTKIVARNAAAALAQLVNELLGLGKIRYSGRLGNFESQRLGCDAGLAKLLIDEVENVIVAE